MSVPGDLIPPKRAAEILRVHRGTLYRWIHAGRLAAYRLRGRYLVSRSEAERLLAELDTPRPVGPAGYREGA